MAVPQKYIRMTEDELTKLAGLLTGSPIGPDSYKLDELLAGLDAERSRLGQRKFVVVVYQQVFDLDGLTDYVFLLDSFNTQSEAIACVESNALNLLAAQTARPDRQGLRWALESVGEMRILPKPARESSLHALCNRTYKLRAGTYDTQYNCFRAVGPFVDFVVCDQLFEFVNAQHELWAYFVKVGEALRTGKPRPTLE